MRRLSICATLCALVLTSVLILGQAPLPAPNAAPASDVVIGSGNFSPIVWDLERSLRFYSDLMGAPAPSTIPAWSTDPALLNFLAAPTGQVRFGSVRIPGSTMSAEKALATASNAGFGVPSRRVKPKSQSSIEDPPRCHSSVQAKTKVPIQPAEEIKRI